MDVNPLSLLEGTMAVNGGVGVPSHWSSNEYNIVQELNQKLIDTALELETFRINANEELTRKEDYIQSLILLIGETSQQRDEARNQLCFLLNNSSYVSQTYNHFDFPESNGIISDNCGIDIADSRCMSKYGGDEARFEKLTTNRPLPEKGKLLQAAMGAGPPAPDLLVADTLLQWNNLWHHQAQTPVLSVMHQNLRTLDQAAAVRSNPFVQSTLDDIRNACSQGLSSGAKRHEKTL